LLCTQAKRDLLVSLWSAWQGVAGAAEKKPATTGPAQVMKNENLEETGSVAAAHDPGVTALWRSGDFMDEIACRLAPLTAARGYGSP